MGRQPRQYRIESNAIAVAVVCGLLGGAGLAASVLFHGRTVTHGLDSLQPKLSAKGGSGSPRP